MAKWQITFGTNGAPVRLSRADGSDEVPSRELVEHVERIYGGFDRESRLPSPLFMSVASKEVEWPPPAWRATLRSNVLPWRQAEVDAAGPETP